MMPRADEFLVAAGGMNHTCPKDFVENRNISNILEEAPPSAQ